jgi:hypothetical protein
MRDHVRRRFKFNKKRLVRLLGVHTQLVSVKTNSVTKEHDEVLRAVVVLLHATLEDLIRGILTWKAPDLLPAFLDQIPFLPEKGKDLKVSLGSLASHRGKSVDDIIRAAVLAQLSKQTFNNPGDIKAAITYAGIKFKMTEPQRKTLGAAMQRRHDIVHQSDRKTLSDTDHGAPRSIDAAEVKRWLDNVIEIGDAVIAAAKA